MQQTNICAWLEWTHTHTHPRTLQPIDIIGLGANSVKRTLHKGKPTLDNVKQIFDNGKPTLDNGQFSFGDVKHKIGQLKLSSEN